MKIDWVEVIGYTLFALAAMAFGAGMGYIA